MTHFDERPVRGATDPREHIRVTIDMATGEHLRRHLGNPVERALTNQLILASLGLSALDGADGHVSIDAVLDATGLSMEIAKNAILVGAWHLHDHSCRRCPQPRAQGYVYVHDILEHQPSAAHKRHLREMRQAASAAGHAVRWKDREPRPDVPRRPRGRPRKVNDSGTEQHPLHPAQARVQRTTRAKKTAADYPPIVHELCAELADLVRRNEYSVGDIGPAWWVPCEKLLRIGPPNAKQGLTPEQIRHAMQWATQHHFWSLNIRSMANLHKQYERLRGEWKKERAAGGPAGAVRRRPGGPPAAVSVPNMGDLFAADMAPAAGGSDGS